MTTGECIKVARKRAGLTQAELALILKIPYQSVGQWERDIRKPKYETLQKIADALGTSVRELLGEAVKSSDSDFQMVMEYTGLTEQALYTLTNGIRTFPGQEFPYHDNRRLIDVLNSMLADSPDFLTMLSFVKLATTHTNAAASWGDSAPTTVQFDADQRGNEELACDYLRAIIKTIRESDKK